MLWSTDITIRELGSRWYLKMKVTTLSTTKPVEVQSSSLNNTKNPNKHWNENSQIGRKGNIILTFHYFL